MARYSRWNRGGRYYGRNRYYYYKKGSTKSKSWGNMKAAKQQADQSTFTINIPSSVSCFAKKATVNIEGQNVDIVKGVRAINVYDLLRKSEFYVNYANMYDEFKIDRIKLKLLPTSWTISTDSSYRNVTVYTAWDRTGLSKEQVWIKVASVANTDTAIGTAGNDDGVYCLVGEDITTYSSSESRTVNPNTNTSIVRWLNPKTMSEKSQWLSTGLLKSWYSGYDDANGRFYGIPTGRVTSTGGSSMEAVISETTGPWVADASNAPSAAQASGAVTFSSISAANKDNPCYLVEDTGFQFKPTLLVGVYPPQESTDANTNVVKFNIEAEVVCSFRGLRKAKVVAA